jgi:hypothetical protein
MSEAGIRVELEIDRLAELVAKGVAERLAGLFPQDAAEFWAALCDQAYRERQRMSALLDLTCPHEDQCPYRRDILADVRLENRRGEQCGDDEAPAGWRSRPGVVASHPVDATSH